jgi:large subunit ribosomal protein L7/L12
MARLKERTRHWRYSRKKIDGLLNQQRTLGILPKDGEQLIVTLREYWEDMNKAADALVKVGKPSVSILIAALEDGDEYVRTLAKGALVKIDTHTLESSIIAGSETVSTIPSSGEHPDGKTTGFTIRLVNSGNMKINVIKIIREVTGLGLQEAKEIADGVSNIVKANLSMDEATAIKMKFEEVGAKVAIVTSAGVISSRSKKTVTTIFGFFTRTKGEALVISLWDDEKWKNTLRTRLGLSGADVILFEEKDWLIPELKSKSIDELKKKYSLIISTIKKKLLLQGVPENVIDEVMKKAEVIPNPITGLVVFVIAYSGDFENNNY